MLESVRVDMRLRQFRVAAGTLRLAQTATKSTTELDTYRREEGGRVLSPPIWPHLELALTRARR